MNTTYTHNFNFNQNLEIIIVSMDKLKANNMMMDKVYDQWGIGI